MTMTFMLGIDAGQTVTKAVLFDVSGRAVATGRVDTTVESPHPGWYERDMTLLWHDAAAAIAECLRIGEIPGRRIAAIGLCGHNDGVYAVDSAGGPVRPAILATDDRARRYAERFADKALALTGQVPFPGSPAAVCAWLRDVEPRTLEKARWLLFAKDWLRLCLTGEAATDPTEASASFTDVRTQDYSGTALDLYGLAGIAAKLPPILPPAQVAGRVTATAAAATGFAGLGTPPRLADATEVSLEVTDAVEAGARGAAALAGVGVGWYSSLDDAVASTVRVTRRHEPQPSDVLRKRFEWYGRLAAATVERRPTPEEPRCPPGRTADPPIPHS
jgi:sugar (pentulose or hexulose) kinase